MSSTGIPTQRPSLTWLTTLGFGRPARRSRREPISVPVIAGVFDGARLEVPARTEAGLRLVLRTDDVVEDYILCDTPSGLAALLASAPGVDCGTAPAHRQSSRARA